MTVSAPSGANAADVSAVGTILRGPTIGERIREWSPAVILFFGALASWELVVRVFRIKQFILPSPVAIGVAWWTYLPELASAARYTFIEVIGGLAIGVTAGLLAGALTARYVAVREAALPFAIAANSIPIIAFAPIFNIWFGLDTQFSKMMIAAVLVFFPVMINTVRGLLSAPAPALELMRSFAASERDIFLRVRMPSAVPYIFTALRISATLATIGAIIGEYFGAPKVSLGQYIVTYTSYLNFERSWGAIIFASAIGMGLYVVVVLVERIVAPWAADRSTAPT